MKQVLIASLLLVSFSSFAAEKCSMAFPKETSAKQLRILAQKFNLVTKDYEFKLEKYKVDCSTYTNSIFSLSQYPSNCAATIVLLDGDDRLITEISGRRGGTIEKSILRALNDLPNCLRGEI